MQCAHAPVRIECLPRCPPEKKAAAFGLADAAVPPATAKTAILSVGIFVGRLDPRRKAYAYLKVTERKFQGRVRTDQAPRRLAGPTGKAPPRDSDTTF